MLTDSLQAITSVVDTPNDVYTPPTAVADDVRSQDGFISSKLASPPPAVDDESMPIDDEPMDMEMEMETSTPVTTTVEPSPEDTQTQVQPLIKLDSETTMQSLPPQSAPSPPKPSPPSHSPVPHSPSAAPVSEPAPAPTLVEETMPLDHPREDAGEDERPLKRARNTYEDNRSTSINRSTSPRASGSGSPAPIPMNPNSSASNAWTTARFKHLQGTIKSLRRTKDAFNFNRPVDAVALNIPHYHNIIKTPMDLGTVERKLNATREHKPNHPDGIYLDVDEFVRDISLIWENSYAFNGREHIVSQAASRLQESFEKAFKALPTFDATSSVPPAAIPVSAPTPKATTHLQKPAPLQVNTQAPPKPQARRQSTSLATPQDPSSLNVNSRPKREIHAPPPKDLSYDAPISATSGTFRKASNGKGKANRKDEATLEQLKFCSKLLQSIFGKQYASWCYFFYDPVDATIVPNYYKTIKKPMDLGTIKKKLENDEYSDASKFRDDVQLVIKNCYAFNPPSSFVHEAGKKLEALFNEKWAGLPPLKPIYDSEDDSSDGGDQSDNDRDTVIRNLEDQVSQLLRTIDSLKQARADKKRRKNVQREDRRLARKSSSRDMDTSYNSRPSNGGSSSQKKAGRPPTSSSSNHKHQSNGKRKGSPKGKESHGVADVYDGLDSALDMVQKKELSEAIEKLQDDKLEKVIGIIQAAVPEIGNNSEEIELEIDALPPDVLQKLYNYVVRPLKTSKSSFTAANKVPKRNGSGNTGRTGSAATGGVKRKSMDEAAEAEKIRILEEKARILAGGAPGMGNGADVDESAQSSDESGSDSGSGSDSDSD